MSHAPNNTSAEVLMERLRAAFAACAGLSIPDEARRVLEEVESRLREQSLRLWPSEKPDEPGVYLLRLRDPPVCVVASYVPGMSDVWREQATGKEIKSKQVARWCSLGFMFKPA